MAVEHAWGQLGVQHSKQLNLVDVYRLYLQQSNCWYAHDAMAQSRYDASDTSVAALELHMTVEGASRSIAILTAEKIA